MTPQSAAVVARPEPHAEIGSPDTTAVQPVVTVGLAVYNGSRWIRDAIDAILSQTYRDFELLISDNCSTDDSYEICQVYARQDPRVRLTRTPRNVGAAENFNVMCRLAHGKYFKYASCNDLCAGDFLLRCVEILEAQPEVVVCHPRTRLLMEDTGDTEDYEITLHLMSDDPIARMKTYLETGGLNNCEQGLIRLEWLRRTALQEQYVGSDINMMAELALCGKFYQVPEFLFYRRMGRQALSALRSPEELAALYTPGKTKLRWQYWKRMLAFSKIAFRAPLKVGERLRMLRYVAQQWRMARHVLLRELVKG